MIVVPFRTSTGGTSALSGPGSAEQTGSAGAVALRPDGPGRTGRPKERPRPRAAGGGVEVRRGWRWSGVGGLLEQRPGLVGVDRDAGAHRGGHGGLADVAAIGGRLLEPLDLVERGCLVLHQLCLPERRLAYDEAQV